MGNMRNKPYQQSQAKEIACISVFSDDKFAQAASISVPDEGVTHKKADVAQHAMVHSLRFLRYRPRSAFEIQVRLERHGYDDTIIAGILEQLRRSGLVDDTSFATFWKDTRQNNSPRSSHRLAQELWQKGIDPEIIADTIQDVNDDIEAYRSGCKKARLLGEMDYSAFRRKLGGFLQRRGFDHETIRSVIEKLWREKVCEDKDKDE